MKKHNAKDYLHLIQAWIEGKDLQTRDEEGVVWKDIKNQAAFTRPPDCYRIKPDTKWYRVALLSKSNRRYIVESERSETDVQLWPDFVRWLTRRVEYE